MGSLKIPASGKVYVDSNCIIYGVEKVQAYAQIMDPLWQAATTGSVLLISSQIAVLEVLIKPIREKQAFLEDKFRQFLLHSEEFTTIPVSLSILERAARVRAETGMRTPDAIHAATALEGGPALSATNDRTFKRVAGLPVVVLSQV